MGGVNGGFQAVIDAFSFYAEVAAALTAVLATAKYDTLGMSDKHIRSRVYCLGGSAAGGGGAALAEIVKLDLASETTSTHTALVLPVDIGSGTATNSDSGGSIFGGFPDSGTSTVDIYDMAFGEETFSLATSALAATMRRGAAVSA
jgi:hypothetical protein